MKDGEIVQTGTPHEFLTNPVNDFVREFVGIRNFSMSINELITPLPAVQGFLSDTKNISLLTPVDEVFELLTSSEQISVEDNGKVIGMILRQQLLK